MYIAIRELGDTKLYYQDDGQWTLDISRAMQFGSSDLAHSTSNFHQMYDVIVESV
jgi:hypothetical protein